MRTPVPVLLAAAALGALGLAAPAAATPLVAVTPAAVDAVPGSYIVTLKDTAGLRAQSVTARLSIAPSHVYSSVLNGFSAKLSDAQLAKLRADPSVARIEQDAEVSADTTQSGATWGIDRIDQPSLPLSGTYTYNADGSGVTAYIIDTGIDADHPDFTGRGQNAYDAVDGTNDDCNGHGTHVAGTIGGATWGVAKNAQLRGVRVLDCGGSGTWAGVIAGMDWVAANHASPAVANMSLGGGFNQSVNDAATRLADSGVFTGVAAGNSYGSDACSASPASAANITTVAASDSGDNNASFSNVGPCVELYAPGVGITSSWLNGGTNTISGTSMATPHVVGVAALYKSTYGDAPSTTVNSWLTANATPGVINGVPAGTPNLLLQTAGL
ncbi:S8 family peptidase [Actinokineospora bangkokensis]|uniref:Peptidase S8 n=1 Tax=Actinokineospora bangkokensis TaxID=1193682 RepID=A0A1Q9LIX2_9PSEU|nr:S8 family peptidase [Actinokineospora bangkokensis]OLR92001.1 hypothetical protein BJP25_24635 [Actinokineospora bangkokensis]